MHLAGDCVPLMPYCPCVPRQHSLSHDTFLVLTVPQLQRDNSDCRLDFFTWSDRCHLTCSVTYQPGLSHLCQKTWQRFSLLSSFFFFSNHPLQMQVISTSENHSLVKFHKFIVFPWLPYLRLQVKVNINSEKYVDCVCTFDIMGYTWHLTSVAHLPKPNPSLIIRKTSADPS